MTSNAGAQETHQSLNAKRFMTLPLVLIIGRANVGKSALFNAMIGRRQALVSKMPGTTRDANIELVRWRDAEFNLCDSAGLEHIASISRIAHRVSNNNRTPPRGTNAAPDNHLKQSPNRIIPTSRVGAQKIKNSYNQTIPLEYHIELRTIERLQRASIRILVVDAEDGLMPQDRAIMKFLRQHGLAFALAINKIDGKADEHKANDFLKLHIQPTILTSAITRRGIGDLLDYIAHHLPHKDQSARCDAQATKTIRVALIGRTNVGKSTLTNTLSESDEMIVSPTPHTTREPHALQIPLCDQYTIELIDTAGVRKKSNIDHFLEIAGVRMSLELLKHVDVVLFVIDVSENLSSQDLALARLIAKHRKPCIIAANKWDLIKKSKNNKPQMTNQAATPTTKHTNTNPKPAFETYIYSNLNKLTYAPILFISAETGENVKTIKPTIASVFENAKQIFESERIKTILQTSLKLQPPPIVGEKKRAIDVRGLYQNPRNPKEFILKVYTRDPIPQHFVSFIEKRLRQSLPLTGVPSYITVENEHKSK